MFIGNIAYIGDKIKHQYSDLKKDDKIVSLVSLSLTPLKIEEIHKVKSEIDQVKVKAQAILFENTVLQSFPLIYLPHCLWRFWMFAELQLRQKDW